LLPTVAVRAVEPSPLTADILTGSWQWIVFTSANAVDVFFQRLAEIGCDARALAPARVAAIGPATSAALRERGISADFTPEKAAAGALAAELPCSAGDCVLLPLSTLAAPDLEAGLKARGAHPYRMEIYETVAARLTGTEIDSISAADAVTFASPSAARALAEALAARELRGRLVSIGPTTSLAVRAALGRVDAEAADRSMESLAMAVEEALAWGS
jgi:uroporphyrinogen III methyltransferase/synthase